MEYEGLTRDDLTNVRALNRAWLRCQGGGDVATVTLTVRRLERLAAAPFLLFSFREQDDRRWNGLLEKRQQDIFAEPLPPGSELHALQSTGLAFLWELARRNPHSARIVSGAPAHWCEQIASATLIRVLDRASRCNLIKPRFETISTMHRGHAQICALHSMLTKGQAADYGDMKAAACQMPKSVRRVADKV